MNNYYISPNNNYLCHSLFNSRNKNHKYYQRIETGVKNGKKQYRYFYSVKEYQAYLNSTKNAINKIGEKVRSFTTTAGNIIKKASTDPTRTSVKSVKNVVTDRKIKTVKNTEKQNTSRNDVISMTKKMKANPEKVGELIDVVSKDAKSKKASKALKAAAEYAEKAMKKMKAQGIKGMKKIASVAEYAVQKVYDSTNVGNDSKSKRALKNANSALKIINQYEKVDTYNNGRVLCRIDTKKYASKSEIEEYEKAKKLYWNSIITLLDREQKIKNKRKKLKNIKDSLNKWQKQLGGANE